MKIPFNSNFYLHITFTRDGVPADLGENWRISLWTEDSRYEAGRCEDTYSRCGVLGNQYLIAVEDHGLVPGTLHCELKRLVYSGFGHKIITNELNLDISLTEEELEGAVPRPDGYDAYLTVPLD